MGWERVRCRAKIVGKSLKEFRTQATPVERISPVCSPVHPSNAFTSVSIQAREGRDGASIVWDALESSAGKDSLE